MTDKQKITEWKLSDSMKSPVDLLYYLSGALEENDTDFIVIACNDVVEIAKEKGWIK